MGSGADVPFHAPVADWFRSSFEAPTPAQRLGWPSIVVGRSALVLAPTGSGKTLAAFLAGLDRLMFSPEPPRERRCRILYVSPLKALAVDVERNLRAPIAGISAAAERSGTAYRVPSIFVRSGDTPAADRAAMRRHPPDILITTPESLYLILTSQAREVLAFVETVIVDEIHSLVPGKRGAHLAVSLERLEALRGDAPPLQRVGLSATVRPESEAARLLAGGTIDRAGRWRMRPVEVIDARSRKPFELSVEVPVEDMTRLGDEEPIPSGPAAARPKRSIWPSIHPRLLELVRAHRSTMIFVNSRRLAERLAGALNDLAGEEVALAHHGSVSRERRLVIEDRLKRGDLPAIVATSSLELGIDMGAVDLVVQIEAPPSVASGMQRIGRAGHRVGAPSKGIILPKYRGDLLASAAVARRMEEGLVEESFAPRNPLDVLAQQVVAIASDGTHDVDELFAMVRRAAAFSDLPRSAFEGVLDMLSGRYPSDEFAELRPRLVWNRAKGTVRGREGVRSVAVANAGTIPDRGLYGVFLAGQEKGKSARVGELDEEMVFESREGDVFLLGASSWRIEEITHDRVVVSPAPGEPGKMPFWHGDRAGRPVELGRAIGALARELAGTAPAEAARRLRAEGLDAKAAKNLLAYLADQKEATGEVPSDRTIVVERNRDEVGDWRVCVHSPFGGKVHAPWSMAVEAKIRRETGLEVETLWSDDGMVFRFPESDAPPETGLFFPDPAEAESLVTERLPETSLFAAHFREAAGRALLLPRRRPGMRQPLWRQRKRSADLLSVASRFPSFPIILETYRECLKDVFDLPGLAGILGDARARKIRIAAVDTDAPSPFAASLLFSYVANFIYDGDAPLAERRAQVLSVDLAQLKELLGEADLRDLLDGGAIEEVERRAQGLGEGRRVSSADSLHGLLLRVGDLASPEIARRADPAAPVEEWLRQLEDERRIARVAVAGEERWIAAEDLGRYRDAAGVVPPRGYPEALLAPVADAAGDLVGRFARTHGPFLPGDAARRLGMAESAVRAALDRLAERGRVAPGSFRAAAPEREWCDVEALRAIKQKSMARLRRQAEPQPRSALARLAVAWNAIGERRRGPEALWSAIEQLQGCALPASVLETEILPARVEGYRPADLDLLCATGEVVWCGIEPIGDRDGRVALFLADRASTLAPLPRSAGDELPRRVLEVLGRRGASFFADVQRELGAFTGDLAEALWDLVWAGRITNDTLAPLRSRIGKSTRQARKEGTGNLRRPRLSPPGTEGRWSLVPAPARRDAESALALARQLLERYGVLTREAVRAEGVPGGFSSLYRVLRQMEEAGRIRRGYFVEGMGAAQFAVPGAEERLRVPDREPKTVVLAATDPANLYGASLPWPDAAGPRPQRTPGALVVVRDGELLAFLPRGEREVTLFGEAPAAAVAEALAARASMPGRRGLLITRIGGEEAASSPAAEAFRKHGFSASRSGLLRRPSKSSEGEDA
ncbi:MAG TPA: DEAD/DEAH box helicase [Thermoanaerobaculia bacterium]|nr:DEAD/DEAH box helicase [Thermoanaerobaculia bacterium]